MADSDYTRRSYTSVILSGQTEGAEVNCRGALIYAVQVPASFEGTSLTFDVTDSGSDVDLYDDTGAEASVPVAASRLVVIPSDIAMALNKFKPTSNIVTGANRTLTFWARDQQD